MLELLLIYFLATGLITDAIVSRSAQGQDRRYGFWHFLLAMFGGSVLVPLAIGLWLFLMVFQSADK